MDLIADELDEVTAMTWTFPRGALVVTLLTISMDLSPVLAQETRPLETAPGPVQGEPEATAPAPQATAPADLLWRAERLIDADIYNTQGQEIGEIEDILIDNDGKVAGVVVSVGGFLGLGDREIVIKFADLMLKGATEREPSVTTSLSEQALQSAPAAPGRGR